VLGLCDLLVSVDSVPPNEDDICWLLQVKGEVEVARPKGRSDIRMRIDLPSFQHLSVDPPNLDTTLRNASFLEKRSPFALSAEPHVVMAAGSHGSEEPSPRLRLVFASPEMWRTMAIWLCRSKTIESERPIVVLVLAFIFFVCSSIYWVLLKHVVGVGKALELNPLPFEERAATTARAPQDEKSNGPSTTEMQRLSEARLMVSIKALRQAAANALGESSEVLILGQTGQARLPFHVIISKVNGGSRIEVPRPTRRSGSHVTVEPPQYMSGANSRSLEIRGSNVALPRGTAATFLGKLEEDSIGCHVVLQDCCPVMFLRGGLDTKSLSVTTEHGKLLASVYESGGSAFNAERQLEMRIDEGADASLVLACALAVAIGWFS